MDVHVKDTVKGKVPRRAVVSVFGACDKLKRWALKKWAHKLWVVFFSVASRFGIHFPLNQMMSTTFALKQTHNALHTQAWSPSPCSNMIPCDRASEFIVYLCLQSLAHSTASMHRSRGCYSILPSMAQAICQQVCEALCTHPVHTVTNAPV